MNKIPTLFARNHETDHLVRDELNPDAEWVAAGEGEATVKLDGTCCMVKMGKLYRRYEVKKGKPTPADFEPAAATDPITGKTVGWRPVGDDPGDKWHREAWETWTDNDVARSDGTYELIGPKVQKGVEGVLQHILVPHGNTIIFQAPRTFDAIRQFLSEVNIEGVVWHHPDGRMAKIKAKDFGMKRGPGRPIGV